MTGLEVAGAVIGVIVGAGSIGWGVVTFIRWIASVIAKAVSEEATGPIVEALAGLSEQVKNLGDQVERLWKKSDEGEQLHRDHGAALAALDARVEALSGKRARNPRKRRKRTSPSS